MVSDVLRLACIFCSHGAPGEAVSTDLMHSRRRMVGSLQTLTLRADLPQSSVDSAIQLFDLPQIWVEQQGFHTELTASAAALYIFTKPRKIPGEQQHTALSTLVQSFKRYFPSVIRDHIDFHLSVFTPSEWVEVLRLPSALIANWPLHPVGTPRTTQLKTGFHLEETHSSQITAALLDVSLWQPQRGPGVTHSQLPKSICTTISANLYQSFSLFFGSLCFFVCFGSRKSSGVSAQCVCAALRGQG